MLNQAIEGYHLSPIQRRLWMLAGDECTNVYRVHATVAVRGSLNRDVLQKSFQMAVQHNEILRTELCVLPGMALPVQVIDDDGRFSEIQELKTGESGLDKVFSAAAAEGASSDHSALEVKLASVDARSHLLTISSPAIGMDLKSLELLVQEVAGLYQCLEAGTNVAYSDVFQYVDVSQWLNELREAKETAPGRKYWRNLGNQIAANLIWSDAENALARNSHLKILHITPVADVMRKIIAGESDAKWTVSGFLLAAWAATLARLGYDANCIAVAFDGRSEEKLSGAVGPLTRYLPVIPGIQMDASFSAALGQVSAAQDRAARRQDCFSWELLSPGKEESAQQPHLVFAFDYLASREALISPSLSFTVTELNGCMDRFGVRLSCHNCNGDLKLDLSWQSHLYEEHETAIMAQSLVAYLTSAVQHPEDDVKTLNLVDPSVQAKLLSQGRCTADFSDIPFVDEQVSRQAARNPHAIAAVCGDQQLPYGELECRANQLGHYLQGLGVGPETCVALCMERSLEMMVGLLGILKAGGAYVPLDPSLPSERLTYMLADSQARLLLTHERLRARFQHAGVPVEVLNGNRQEIARHGAPPESKATGENPAYVIYTSGSTGRPKAVVLTRSGLKNYVTWASSSYECTSGGSAPLCSSLGFDLTITSLWPILASGGSVVLAPERDGMEWLARSQRKRYEVVKITPAHLRMLEELLPLQSAGISKCFVIGGEALRWEELQYWRNNAAGARLINEYGPTETAVGSCIYEIGEEWQDHGGVPIGRPIANTEVYVLDKEMLLLPAGIKGELYIGGAGMARGYLGHPELTAERFVPHPFSQSPGERLYRTGDQVRWGADGNLEFFGRDDGQVKIRGYRIELAEIEAALLRFPEIKQAAVIVREEQQEKRLIAYFVGNSPARVDQELMVKALQTELPDYMIPSGFMQLDELPLTRHGKVDRKALPRPSEISPGRDDLRFQNREEEILCGLYAELLRREVDATDESFFALGGHSLLATRLISRVKNIFGIDLPLRTLFDSPTVSGLAQRVREARGVISPTASALEPAQRGDRLPLSFAQRRLWILDRIQPNSGAYNIHFGLRMAGKLDKKALQRSLDALLLRHEVLRTSFPEIDGQPVQQIAAEMKLQLQETDLRQLCESEREAENRRLAYEEANKPFDLSRGPLVRARLLQLDERMHVFLVTLHHIISDGWSVAIMVEEFSRLYAAYTRQESLDLPELKVQYADFAIWQAGWLRGEVLEQHLKYWRTRLAGAEPLRLPTDRPRTPQTGRRGGRETFELGLELTKDLKALAQREGVTLFMALLAAFQWTLARHTGQEDIVVGTDFANRNRLEIEGLIGFFVNQLVLRGDLSGNPSFRETLRRARQIVLEAYDHQDLPFEKLVEELAPERDASATPLFSVKLVLQNVRRPDLSLPDLSVTPMDLQEMEAKFDILVNLTETGNGLTAFVHYNADSFSSGAVRTLLHFYRATLLVITEDNAILDAGKQEFLLAMARKVRTQVQHVTENLTPPVPRKRQIYSIMKA